MEAIKNIFNKIGGFFKSIYLLLVNFLNSYRAFVVKYFALSYESRILGKKMIGGKTGKYPRVVLFDLITFFIAIWSTLIIDNLGLWDNIQNSGAFFEPILTVLFVLFYFIFWIPFLVTIWIGFPWGGLGYFELFPVKYGELKNNEQKFQLLGKPTHIGYEDETFPEGFKYQEEYRKLAKWHHSAYDNKSNVNVLLGLLPFILTGGGFYIAYLILANG